MTHHCSKPVRLTRTLTAFVLAVLALGLTACGGSSGSGGSLVGGHIQGTALNLTGKVTTLAGSTTAGNADGTGAAASFHTPMDMATDGTNLYVADYGNNEIRKIVIKTGKVTTLAGSGVAGSADGTGSAASFNIPFGVTTDGTNLYVADYGNNEIRKIVIKTGVVTTLAGSPTSGSADGTGALASFNQPHDLTIDGPNLYVADMGNNEIRKIVIATGAVTTFAGSTTAGSTNGTGTAAAFSAPDSITTDGTNLYVSDWGNEEIREINIATAAVTTLAGTTGVSGSADGTGSAASFYHPFGITTDGTNVYVADTWNSTIREINIATAAVTTLAGTADVTGSTDGTAALFNYPVGITSNGTSLYVGDQFNNEIRKIQ